eukprot:gene7490-10205_t
MTVFEQSQVKIAHALLVLAQVAFCGWHVIGAKLLHGENIHPLLFALYREILASFIMLISLLYIKHDFIIHPKDWKLFIYLGGCCCVNVLGAIASLTMISSNRFAIYQPSIPCIAALISVCFKLEKVTTSKILGIVLAVIGAIIVESAPRTGRRLMDLKEHDEDNNPQFLLEIEIFIKLLQCTAMANLIVFQKSLVMKYKPLFVTFTYYSIGTLFTFVIFIFTTSYWSMSASDAKKASSYQLDYSSFALNYKLFPWIALGYVTIFATLFTYNAIAYAGKVLSPSTTTLYVTIQPVGTFILSYLVFGSTISINEIIGGFLVICGLITTVYGQQRLSTNAEISETILTAAVDSLEGTPDDFIEYDFTNSKINARKI